MVRFYHPIGNLGYILFRRLKNPLPSRTPSQSQVPKPSMQKTQPDTRTARPPWPAGPAVPIRVPSQTDRLPSSKPAVRHTHPEPEDADDDDEEVVKIPDFHNDNTVLTPAEAEKALRDLMSGAMNQDLDSDIDIDMSQEIVDGFKDGIKLLPHQILGRAWMKDREDLSKKRTGGILADDMGYDQISFSGIISVNLFSVLEKRYKLLPGLSKVERRELTKRLGGVLRLCEYSTGFFRLRVIFISTIELFVRSQLSISGPLK